MTNTELEHVAREVRKDILVATHAAKSGHPGGSLSAADILKRNWSYLALYIYSIEQGA